ncbi:MAG: DNA-binding protein [Rhodoferax sp.]
MKSLLNVEQLSTCIHKSVASIRSDATRNPRSLPPLCRLPGTKRLLWREEDVAHWVAIHVIGIDTPTITKNSLIVERPAAKRGRPTKTEQIARQRLKSGAHATDQTHSNTKG